MNLTRIPELKEVVKMTGGLKGVVYKLTDVNGERTILKFQKEPTVEAVAETHILQQVGAKAPDVHVVSNVERARLTIAVANALWQSPKMKDEFYNADKDFKYLLVMDYAEGSSIGDMQKHHVLQFLRVICDSTFQMQLGKILAADAFAGNSDRMFAKKTGGGWYNAGNTFIQQGPNGKSSPVAIDNSFSPGISVPASLPYGVKSPVFQQMSVTAANDALVRDEAGLIFDVFLREAKKGRGSSWVPNYIDAMIVPQRGAFQNHVAAGAKIAMNELLARGQGWKQKLTNDGADQALLQTFKVRKRLLRQVQAGVDAKDGLQTAQNDDEYRKWVLTNELGMKPDEADELLSKGVNEYKAYKKLWVALC